MSRFSPVTICLSSAERYADKLRAPKATVSFIGLAGSLTESDADRVFVRATGGG